MSLSFATIPGGFTASDPRADGAIRHISFHDGKVTIARRLGGVAMRVDVPCSAYRGVVLSMEGEEDDATFTIRLDHMDPDLSVVVHAAEDDCDVVAQWHAWSKLTGLPRFVERDAGELVGARELLGAVVLGRSRTARRRGAIAIRRRPRFLARRQVGSRKLMKRLPASREIIARD